MINKIKDEQSSVHIYISVFTHLLVLTIGISISRFTLIEDAESRDK